MTVVFIMCLAAGLASADGPQVSAGSPAQLRLADPAVEAYTSFVAGKQLGAPADRRFIFAALDRLVSAVEGLALRETEPDAALLSAAQRVRKEIRLLRPFAPDTDARMKDRWRVFTAAALLVDDLASAIGSRGADKPIREALLRAADSIDFDDPARMQPEALEYFFTFAARALKQMDAAGSGRLAH